MGQLVNTFFKIKITLKKHTFLQRLRPNNSSNYNCKTNNNSSNLYYLFWLFRKGKSAFK